jgi:hypothetical protein
LCLTIAHQYIGQLDDEIRKTVFGNVGSIASFRVGAEDAVILAEEYTPIFNVRDIINLGVREFYLKMSIDGELTEPFSGKTLDMKFPEHDYSKEILEASRKNYCTDREDVEAQLKSWDEAGANNQSHPVSTAQGSGMESVGGPADFGEPVFEMPLI